VQTEVWRLFLWLRITKRKLSVFKRTRRTCPSIDIAHPLQHPPPLDFHSATCQARLSPVCSNSLVFLYFSLEQNLKFSDSSLQLAEYINQTGGVRTSSDQLVLSPLDSWLIMHSLFSYCNIVNKLCPLS
jgi:hypothetical protein